MISVLVPVYGVASYIEECLVSLFEQTCQDLEYIFVDDCSPDDSIDILQRVVKRYPQRQGQVHIIRHEQNRGLGAARATALQAAHGDFVMVVDSDDVLPVTAIETLWRRQQETGADMVDGAFRQLTPEGLQAPVLPWHGSRERLLRLMLVQNVVYHQLWGRLVRRSVYTDNDINSIEGVNMAEDYAVTPRLLYCASRAWTDEVVYHYRVNAQSTFADNLTTRHIESFLRANGAVYSFMTAHDVEHRYRCALHIGLLRACAVAQRVGWDDEETARLLGYRLPRVLRHAPLYLIYLVAKRLYTLF
jgi:glycosyltransferase involved in cell wall biosynthesis